MPKDITIIDRLLALGGELQHHRKFDLAHMRLLIKALGDPQARFPSILIAGTNGKGSTAATLAAIMHAGGYRVGLYTSPHLETPNERIRVSNEPISDNELAACFSQVEAASSRLLAEGQLPHLPSFFESMTAIAFLAFAGPPAVDIAILEVGLGGRLDATNVVEPVLSILTDIALDHTEWLGETVGAITREKAGILRPGGTLITLPQHPEANQVIGEVAVPLGVRAVNAAEYLPARVPGPTTGELTLAGLLRNRYDLTLQTRDAGPTTLHVDSALAGSHQQRNLALAIAAALQLDRDQVLRVTPNMIEQGIRNTEWPGRLQLLDREQGPHVLIDAAHNPAGAWALRAALSPLPISGSRTLIFGCMADKAVTELAQILFPVFDYVILTKAQNARSASVLALKPAAEAVGVSHTVSSSASSALEAALRTTPPDGLVVVAGSVALVGECMAALKGLTKHTA